MYVFIGAQDIGMMHMGLVRDGVFLHLDEHKISPEQYLMTLNEALKTWNVSLEQLDGLIVVTGPGSFTASRISVSIVNTIAFAQKLPIIPVRNEEHLSPEKLLSQIDFSSVEQGFVSVFYSQPPHITHPSSKLPWG